METKPLKEPMILVSTGNSGSSALMHVLSECGLFLGYTKSYKIRNHYEHSFFQQVNKRIFKLTATRIRGSSVAAVLYWTRIRSAQKRLDKMLLELCNLKD